MTDELVALVRRRDPDRFLTALFAPLAKRQALLALYAFNHELARAREVASEPMLALIRLQWWREVVEGARRKHEVAGPLGSAIDAGLLDPADLLALIEAREAEAEPALPSLQAWRTYVLGAGGGLSVAAGRALGAPEPERLRDAGAAYLAAGQLRSVRLLARRGRCLLPADLLAEHGLSPEAVTSAPTDPALGPVVCVLAQNVRAWVAEIHHLSPSRQAIPAILPVVLARRDLARLTQDPAPRSFGDRLAVVLAGLRGRV